MSGEQGRAEGCVPCRVCGGDQTRGWHRHDQGRAEALSAGEREAMTAVVKSWLPVSYGGLISRLEAWITERDAALRAEWETHPLDPAYRDVEVCTCSTPGWTHHTGFHMFVEDREQRAVRRARAEWEAQAKPGDIVTVRLNSTDTLAGKVYEAPDAGARTADHAAELRAATSAGYIRGYGKASADAAQVARVVAAAREAGL